VFFFLIGPAAGLRLRGPWPWSFIDPLTFGAATRNVDAMARAHRLNASSRALFQNRALTFSALYPRFNCANK